MAENMSISSNNSDGPITEINLTPMVDVCLVLVIIFMAVAPFAMQAGIRVLQSKKAGARIALIGKVSLSDSVQVKLTKDGVLSVNGAQTDAEHFGGVILNALSASKDKFVIVKADEANKVGEVVGLLDEARQAGAVKMALMRN
ncbi:MAG: biopolymer transporter ExbD [Elusimicrobia bacterium]|nr:biopolymer transporter ExbD [Elusimicrobiota bacterium]